MNEEEKKPSQKDVILRVRHLKQYFRFGTGIGKYNKAVHDVSFDVHRGEVVGLVGESGCGKTTTGRTIIKLYPPTSGSVYFEGYRIVAGTRWNEKEIKWKRIAAEAKIKSIQEEEKDELDSIDKTIPSDELASQKAEIRAHYAPLIQQERDKIDALVAKQRKKIRLAKHDDARCNKDFAKEKKAATNARFRVLLSFAFHAKYGNNLRMEAKLYDKLYAYGRRKSLLLNREPDVRDQIETILEESSAFAASYLGVPTHQEEETKAFKAQYLGVIDKVNAIFSSATKGKKKGAWRQKSSKKLDEKLACFVNALAIDAVKDEDPASLDTLNQEAIPLFHKLIASYFAKVLAYVPKKDYASSKKEAERIASSYAEKAGAYLAKPRHSKEEKKAFFEDFFALFEARNTLIPAESLDDVDVEMLRRIDRAFRARFEALPVDEDAAPFANRRKVLTEYFLAHRLARKSGITQRIQMIFQDPIASLDPRMTVKEIIAEGLKIRGVHNRRYITEQVNSVLREVGLLPEHSSRYPHEFSGGQRQRIGIARALIMNPDLIIADEPISALDVSIQAQVINLLNRLREERNLSILFIAHDLSVVKYFCDEIAVMYFGNLVEFASSDELFAHPLHPYTRSLLSAIPLPDPHYEKNRKRMEYDPYQAHDYTVDKPSFREVSPGHFVRCNQKEFEGYEQALQGK